MWARVDVAIAAESSWTCETLDHLTVGEDHDAVVWEVEMAQPRHSQSAGAVRRPRFDRNKLMSPAGRALLNDALQAYQPPPWEMHPDDHATHVQDFLTAVLYEHFLQPPQAPRASYVSEAVWAARSRCMLVKKKTRRWNEGFKAFVLQHVLHRWRYEAGTFPMPVRKSILIRELFAAAIRVSTHWTKQQLALDKRQYMQHAALRLAGCTPQEVNKRLSQIGVGGRLARAVRKPPPALKDPATGAHVCGGHELDQLWMKFFDMECGEVVGTSSFIDACLASPSVELHVPEPSLLPTVRDIEQVFRNIPAGKAHGLDCLPAELFRSVPAAAASVFAPLFAKATLTCRQPAEWRGGVLQEAFKGRGSASEVANFRSLFISSLPAKAHHKLMRRQLQPAIAATLHDLHCGVSRGKPVSLPTLATRLIVTKLKRMGASCGILFLDTAHAYYSVIRELVLGPLSEDSNVWALLQRFGLGEADMKELHALVVQGGILSSLDVSEHLLKILRDLYSQSWFVTRFSTGEHVVCTQAGSRPGSAFADLVFHIPPHAAHPFWCRDGRSVRSRCTHGGSALGPTLRLPVPPRTKP